MVCVRPGVDETLLILDEVSAFTKLDFPTFERPTHTKTRSNPLGRLLGETNAPKKAADDMVHSEAKKGKKGKLPDLLMAVYARIL